MDGIVFVSYVSNRGSGVGSRVYHLSRELGRQGLDVTVLTRPGEYVDRSFARLSRATNLRVPLIPPVPLVNVELFNLQACGVLKKILSDRKRVLADVQHVHASHLLNLLSKNLQVRNRIVLTCHGTEAGTTRKRGSVRPSIARRLMISQEAFTFRLVSSFVCVTRFVRDELVDFYGVPPEKIAVVPNGVDLSEFQRVRPCGIKARLGQDILLLNIGGLSMIKGAFPLLRALSTVKKLRWVMVMIGEGPYRERSRLLELEQKLGLKDRIIHFKRCSRSEIASLLAEADIYVHPSIYESQGIAILEAMASRKPVIASRVGGIPETLSGAGVLVEPNDPVGLANAIVTMLQDSGARSRYASLGYERAKMYDWASIASRYRSYILQQVG